jgi:hypothetical protein
MDPCRLPADQAVHAMLRPSPVDAGWARVLSHGPMTIGAVLERGRDEMKAQERAKREAAGPVAYVRAHRARRSLLGRLLGR